MFNIPERYEVGVKLALKDFVPKDLKPADKKRIRDAIKEVKLSYQIAGEEIPSVIDDNYRCQVVQFYDMEVNDIKDAAFLASTYQEIIKPFCVLHIFDVKDEIYSFSIKRLSQTEENQIVIEKKLTTERFKLNVPDSARDEMEKYMDFSSIKNKQDKVGLYKEWFYKAYILLNQKAYAGYQKILDSNCWYDVSKSSIICQKYEELVSARESLKKANSNAEKMQINKSIKSKILDLDNENI